MTQIAYNLFFAFLSATVILTIVYLITINMSTPEPQLPVQASFMVNGREVYYQIFQDGSKLGASVGQYKIQPRELGGCYVIMHADYLPPAELQPGLRPIEVEIGDECELWIRHI